MVLMGGKQKLSLTLEESYAACREITRSASTSFMRSFRHLPVEKRNAVYALYAFCRRVDDIADGDWLPDLSDLSPGHVAELDRRTEDRSIVLSLDKQTEASNPEPDHSHKLRGLIYYRDMLSRASKGLESNDPIFIALGDVLDKFPIRLNDLNQLIDGMEDDL